MEWRYAVFIMFLLISAMSMAGCSGPSSAPVTTPSTAPVATIPVSTPVPAVKAFPATPAAVLTTPDTVTPYQRYSKTYSFDGTGDFLHTFTTTSPGTMVFSMTYPQEGDFLVRLQDDQYNDIEILADTGGLSAPRTKSVWLKAGTYNLDITADAPWMITASTV